MRSDRPIMKNRARWPARRSVPAPSSSPMTCGYHVPPERIRVGAGQSGGSNRGGDET